MTADRDVLAAALPAYEIGEELGRGGAGVVVRGRHRALGREVAIKQLPADFGNDEAALQRFIDEARTIGQVDHPHVVKVYDFSEHEGLWLMVMEYLGGGTLWDRFAHYGMRSDQACAVTLAMCAGLKAAHDHGVLHRDVKPENILFTTDGIARLADFGIAKTADTDTRRTRVGEVIGTPTYMAPEQALGENLTPACDIYGLAVILYELLAGRLPFDEARTPTQQLLQHVSEAPLPLSQTAPDIPESIQAVVMRGLEKDPANRYATAEEFGIVLAEAAASSYGSDWLRESGTRLMGGGAIAAAAHQASATPGSARLPTMTVAALRSDHFRVDDRPPTGGETIAAPAATASSPPNSYAKVLTGSAVALAVLILIAVVLFDGGGDTSLDEVAAQDTGIAETETTLAAASTTLTPTSSAAPTTTSASPSTTVPAVPERTCPAGARCAFIDDVTIDGNSFVIDWVAAGFEPSYRDGFFHVHFFWDIYSPDQVGTNNATFGVPRGAWELTDEQPFRTTGELLVSNRPEPANQLCVTVTNFAHAVVDPRQFECVLIPEAVSDQ